MLLTWLLIVGATPAPSSPRISWVPLAEGIEYAKVSTVNAGDTGDVHLVRIDPARTEWQLGLASETGSALTASEWARREKFTVTINAGMYDTDLKTNVGFMRHGAHRNQPRWHGSYESVLLLQQDSVRLVDRDAQTPALAERSNAVVQNLRLLKAPGVSVWQKNGRAWSEALLADDDQGRMVMVFTRVRFEMADLMALLLSWPLHLVHAMHLDGGPPASFSVHSKALTLDLSGDNENAVFRRPVTAEQLEIPNVIGVRPRPKK